MVPLGDLDVRNRVRIPSRTVKSKTSRAALTSVILAGFRRPNHEFACCGLMYTIGKLKHTEMSPVFIIQAVC